GCEERGVLPGRILRALEVLAPRLPGGNWHAALAQNRFETRRDARQFGGRRVLAFLCPSSPAARLAPAFGQAGQRHDRDEREKLRPRDSAPPLAPAREGVLPLFARALPP